MQRRRGERKKNLLIRGVKIDRYIGRNFEMPWLGHGEEELEDIFALPNGNDT